MEIIIKPNSTLATSVAARLIAALIRRKPKAVLGLATGNTPLQLYRELISMELDWSEVTTFNLDEYIGLSATHPQSYRSFMQENLFQHTNIVPSKTFVPDGMAEDIPGSCQHYEQMIHDAGGIDLQLLGIGSSGHIGFNEATSSLSSRTRIKTLTMQTCIDNAPFFGDVESVPRHVITMGIGTIMEARHCLLLAFGSGKAKAISEAVEGPITAMNPASVLQMHPKVTVCLDNDAASELKMQEYYHRVYNNKPAWEMDL